MIVWRSREYYQVIMLTVMYRVNCWHKEGFTRTGMAVTRSHSKSVNEN